MIASQPRPLFVLYLVLFTAWVIGEIVLLRRSKGGVVVKERGGIWRTGLALVLGQVVADLCLAVLPWANFGGFVTSCVGVTLMTVGLAIRWWSVALLGRFFTLNLRVAADQTTIDTGPYRFVRHPSYTGFLLLLFGMGLCFGNVVSLLALFVPMVAILFARMSTEEGLLSARLGDSYRMYMQRTKRLVPGIY